MSFNNRATKEQLAELYKAWSGPEAQQFETQCATATPQYMVTVVRHVGRHLKHDEYPFATGEIAQACYKFWRARGGLVTLTLCKVIDEYGYTQEPVIHM